MVTGANFAIGATASCSLCDNTFTRSIAVTALFEEMFNYLINHEVLIYLKTGLTGILKYTDTHKKLCTRSDGTLYSYLSKIVAYFVSKLVKIMYRPQLEF